MGVRFEKIEIENGDYPTLYIKFQSDYIQLPFLYLF